MFYHELTKFKSANKEQVSRSHHRVLLNSGSCRTVTMRITLKFLVKSLIVLILLIFILPLFLHHLDSKEWEKMEELARERRDRAVSMICSICDNHASFCVLFEVVIGDTGYSLRF